MTIKFDTQVCLVSEQAIPNLTPALDHRLRPARLVLVAASAMEKQAGWLAEVFGRHGIMADIEPLGSADDFQAMREKFSDIARRHPGAALNSTGGKKTMSIAAFDAFREAGRPIFYVETDNRLHWLSPQGIPPLWPESISRFEDYFGAYGQAIDSLRRQNSPIYREDFCTRMITETHAWSTVAPCLEPIGKEMALKTIGFGQGNPGRDQRIFLDFAVARGLAQKKNNTYLATGEQVSFLKGGWLEEHVFRVIDRNRQAWSVDDLCYNIRISSHSTPDVRNEFDVAVLRKNRIYLIECKAIRETKKSPVTDFIYKLDSARKAGGLMAQAMLVNWTPIPKGGSRNRAESSRIALVAGQKELCELEAMIAKWLGVEKTSQRGQP